MAGGNSLKIVVSGATGKVGRLLVPRLLENGVELLLLGRDLDKLRIHFPEIACDTYDQWTLTGEHFDAFLHLAALNNDANAAPEEFESVNVEFASKLASAASEVGIPTFINVSSVLALQPWNRSAYALSKRAGAERLSSLAGIHICNLYLPFVLSRRELPPRLSWLAKLPSWLRDSLLDAICALKPTVSLDQFAQFLIAGDWRQRSEVVLSSGQADNRFYNVAARTIDVGFAIAVLLLLWWLLLVIAILVRLDSAGSPIFAQPRVGRNGALFTCYKFRTMSVGTPHVATHEAGATSVTRIGRFLRRSKLDELLQVVNLIPGHLSLIGPRPCLSSQTELIEARTKLGVLRLRPGISGLSQIMDIDMSGPERLACYDARYVGMQSLVVDLNIILWTAMGKGNVDRIRI